jgi:hypothetical protein
MLVEQCSQPSFLVRPMRDSLFLMERPSFIEGMARAVDIGDSMTNYNYSPNGDQADHAGIWADWELIAGDLRVAAQRYATELGRVKT